MMAERRNHLGWIAKVVMMLGVVLTSLVLVARVGQEGAVRPEPTSLSRSVPADKPEGSSASHDGPMAPDIAVKDLDGNVRHLSDYRGKMVVLNFRTTWCGFCRSEVPVLQAAHEKFADLVILGVNIQEDAGRVVSYVDELGISFPMLIDVTGRAARTYGVRGIPCSFFIDPEGRVFDRQVGPLTLEGIEYRLGK